MCWRFTLHPCCPGQLDTAILTYGAALSLTNIGENFIEVGEALSQCIVYAPEQAKHCESPTEATPVQ